MSKDVNTKKVVRQHKEMDDFFSGGFAVRPKTSKKSAAVQDDDVVAGLKQIAEQVEQCCQCGLGKTRKHAVPGEGNPHAKIVFVGEAPGAEEDEQGRPFVGRAGQLLDKIINAMGLRRQDVFICNVLKCRPPDNRDPSPEEIIRCMPLLERQLELIRPEVIVALGAHAARTLLKSEAAIGNLRGRFHDYYTQNGYGPIKLMPTYHPAYLLRNYSDDNRRRVWEDMQKVLEYLGLPVPKNKAK